MTSSLRTSRERIAYSLGRRAIYGSRFRVQVITLSGLHVVNYKMMTFFTFESVRLYTEYEIIVLFESRASLYLQHSTGQRHQLDSKRNGR